MTLSLITGSLALVVLVSAAPAFAGQQSIPSVEQHVIVTAHATGVPFEQVTRSVEVITESRSSGCRPRRSPTSCGWSRGSTCGRAVPLVSRPTSASVALRSGRRWCWSTVSGSTTRSPVITTATSRWRWIKSSANEILQGAGSSLHGADAFGGTINVIPVPLRSGPLARIGGGQFRSVGGSASATLKAGATAHVVAVEGSHSDGFMVQRGYDVATVGIRSALSPDTRVFAGFTRKNFGANGFYGPSPSQERTNQFLLGGNHRVALPDGVAAVRRRQLPHAWRRLPV